MYPIIRMLKEFVKFRNMPIAWNDVHVSTHICWPWDLDVWMELNNGRSLTLYDLSRVPFAMRVGLAKAVRENGWSLSMAGASVRWRARVRAFDRIEIQSRCVGWDDRFIYLMQDMWKADGTCAGQILCRTAAANKDGIVAPSKVMLAMGGAADSPELPEWVMDWIKAESIRPWPPENQALR